MTGINTPLSTIRWTTDVLLCHWLPRPRLSITALTGARMKKASDFDSMQIGTKDLTVTFYLNKSVPKWDAFLISFLNRVADLGHLERLCLKMKFGPDGGFDSTVDVVDLEVDLKKNALTLMQCRVGHPYRSQSHSDLFTGGQSLITSQSNLKRCCKLLCSRRHWRCI